jgi:hypothetical protein
LRSFSKDKNATLEVDTRLKTDKNLHGATRYVQNAVEGAVKTTHDATQNLVNSTIKKDPASSEN